MREQLQADAESRAQQQGIPLEQTPEYQDLRTTANVADDQVLIKHKVVAPHPRRTLWLGERGEKWYAIIKANLPVFVLAGEAVPKVSALRDFDRAARGRQRGDVKARAEVWAERNLYLPAYLPVVSGWMWMAAIGCRSRRLRRIDWAASPTRHRPSACAQLWLSSEISVSVTAAILVGPAGIGRPGSLPRLVRAAIIRKITVTKIDRSTRCSHRRT